MIGRVAATGTALVSTLAAVSIFGASTTPASAETIPSSADVRIAPETPTPGGTVQLAGSFVWPDSTTPNSGSCGLDIDGGKTTAAYECRYTADGTVTGSVTLPADLSYGDHFAVLRAARCPSCSSELYFDAGNFTFTVLPTLVPDVRCLPVVEAVGALEASGFVPTSTDDVLSGWVTSQEPAGDTPHDGVADVSISTTTIADTPSLVGLSYDEAMSATGALCLGISADGKTLESVVVQQLPEEGEPIEPGGIVYVEMGPTSPVTPPTITPDTSSTTTTPGTSTTTPTQETTPNEDTTTPTQETTSTPTQPTDSTETTAATGGGGGGDDGDAGPLDPLSGAWPDNDWLVLVLLLGLAGLALAGGRVGRILRTRQDRTWVASHVTINGLPATAASIVDPTVSPPNRPDLGMALVAMRRRTTTRLQDLS
jgi:hypothetical protein